MRYAVEVQWPSGRWIWLASYSTRGDAGTFVARAKEWRTARGLGPLQYRVVAA